MVIAAWIAAAAGASGCAAELMSDDDLGQSSDAVVTTAGASTRRSYSGTSPSAVTLMDTSVVSHGSMSSSNPSSKWIRLASSPTFWEGHSGGMCEAEPHHTTPVMRDACSGTVIAHDLILTADHCVEDASDMRVLTDYRAGGFSYNRTRTSAEGIHMLAVERVYRNGPLDVAVLHVEGSVGVPSARPYCGTLTRSRRYTAELSGNGEGLPLMHRSGPLRPSFQRFQLALDVFRGDSGAGVMVDGVHRADLGRTVSGERLVGVFVEGRYAFDAPDYIAAGTDVDTIPAHPDYRYGRPTGSTQSCVFRAEHSYGTAQESGFTGEMVLWEDFREDFCRSSNPSTGQQFMTTYRSLCCLDDAETGGGGTPGTQPSDWEEPVEIPIPDAPIQTNNDDSDDDEGESTNGGTGTTPGPTCQVGWSNCRMRDSTSTVVYGTVVDAGTRIVCGGIGYACNSGGSWIQDPV